MQARDVMTQQPQYLNADATIREAALHMRQNDMGFVPVASNDHLIGIVTDRDLAMRSLTDGASPDQQVSSMLSEGVLYCYAEDDIEDVLQNMQEQNIQRLMVLDNPEDKNLAGVISLSDIADKCDSDNRIAGAIVDACKHYH